MYRLIIPTLILQSLSIYQVNADIKWKNVLEERDQTETNIFNLENNKNPIDSSIKWKKIIEMDGKEENNRNWTLSDLENDSDFLNEFYVNNIDVETIYLGNFLPTANTLRSGDIETSFTQVSAIKGAYYKGGTGNQNYIAKINYGLNDNLTISSFYSHSDDPLHVKINNLEKQPSNLWISYGAGFTWNSLISKNLKIALNGSLESWLVKSGGCNLYKCTSQSNNIFNTSINEVENNNLVGSVSLPITWNPTKRFELSLSPRAIFLPSSQGNDDGSGSFYGNTIGIATGIEFKPFKRFKLYSSSFIPMGPGYNSFDEDLTFSRKNIYSAGLNFSVDTKTAIEGSITNGFGLTPSTSILALPSSNQRLYALKIIYRPTNYAWNYTKPKEIKRSKFNGLSVSNAYIINEGKRRVQANLDSKGSWVSTFDIGLSESFNVDLSFSSIGQESNESGPFKDKYHNVDEYLYRGGGKIELFKNSSKSFLSAVRLSAGRLMGNGWIFGELLNTYEVNDRTKFNLNPKFSLSGVGNPLGVGTSLHWEIIPGITLIPETNIALKESQNNWTLAVRISPFKGKFVDLYTTNSLSFIDTGQLLRSKEQSFGVNIGTIF